MGGKLGLGKKIQKINYSWLCRWALAGPHHRREPGVGNIKFKHFYSKNKINNASCKAKNDASTSSKQF